MYFCSFLYTYMYSLAIFLSFLDALKCAECSYIEISGDLADIPGLEVALSGLGGDVGCKTGNLDLDDGRQHVVIYIYIERERY